MEKVLNDIKEQLFDAPSEVKSAFNTVVGYFDGNKWKDYIVILRCQNPTVSKRANRMKNSEWRESVIKAPSAQAAVNKGLKNSSSRVFIWKAFPADTPRSEIESWKEEAISKYDN